MATKSHTTEKTQHQQLQLNGHPANGANGIAQSPALPKPNQLTALGEKIFLDRYALKDGKKESLAVGDIVVVAVNLETGQREIGTVTALNSSNVTIELRDGEVVKRAREQLDKPLEIRPEQMLDRVAWGMAQVEAPDKQNEWQEKFRWLLDDWKFVPGGRILTAAGTDQNLTFYNCYVIPSPKDSRGGIMTTLTQMTEIMSRGGGVGINISSLRPHHAYVKGVNGRSSGAVSWGELYSFVTGLIEQGGCLTPDTLVFTEKGLLRLDEIVEHTKPGWSEQNLVVMTDAGNRLSRQVFNNGVAEVLRVDTDMGLQITGTPNHKVKVMTLTGPQWRQLDELQSGDAIMVKLGQHQGKFQALNHPAYQHHNQNVVDLPSILDEELAFFLGYFVGDGFMTTRDGDWRLGVAVSHDSYLLEEMPMLMQRLFPGVKVRTQQKQNDASLIYIISNRAVKEFVQLNGFDKAQSNQVCVPRLIRQSPPEVVGAFLRGLFEADGGLSHNYPALSSSSKLLIDEVAVLLIGLGCPVKVEPQPVHENRYGHKPMWRLRIHSFRGLENWQHRIGCDAQSRFAACADFEPDKTKEVTYKLPHAEYWLEPVITETTLPQTDHRATGQRFKASDQQLRRKLLRYIRGDRNLTLSAYDTLSQTHPDFANLARPVNDMWFVFVDRVTKAGQSLTLDLEVEDNHTYLANGLVTHNSRRGALMLIMNVWHPDVLTFISSKRAMGRITNANISVGITDDFMEAVKADADWNLVFPDTAAPGYDDAWDGNLAKWQAEGRPVVVHKTVRAREVWDAIIESAWASAEPGVFFVERYNKMSNSWYFAPILCTNPCGEQGLPAWGVCNLGALNLAKFVTDGQVDWDSLGKGVRYAIRFLDDVIDATPYFFEENKQQQLSERRVGMGTMGLAEMMIRLKIRYGSPESVDFLDKLYGFIAAEAYLASAEYAAEKGAFPNFEADKFLQSGFMEGMPENVREAIREQGIRNVTLLTQAPTGTTGTMVNTSTGIEPFYFWSFHRKGRMGTHEERVAIYDEWLTQHPDTPLPDYFVTAMDLRPEDHVRVQAAIQRWVDSSISKTCNTPHSYTIEQTRELYELMYDLGCKGGTIYRDGSRDVQVLNLKEDDKKEVSEKSAAAAPEIKWRVRPSTLHGNTYRKNTPIGTAYITVNANGAGDRQPFEVFINIGKVGSDVAADAEGLGRLVSMILRMPSPLTPEERVADIVAQLRGIGSGRAQGFGKNRVMSMPDAIAQVLAEHVGISSTGDLPGLPDEDEAAQLSFMPKGDLCPSCGQASLLFIEGCKKCHECGYSEC